MSHTIGKWKLSEPVTIGRWTFRGVDNWSAFCTNLKGEWFYVYTECSKCWRDLPKAFIGACGWPDTAEGVLATAILEVRAEGYPDRCSRCDKSRQPELELSFGGSDTGRGNMRELIIRDVLEHLER